MRTHTKAPIWTAAGIRRESKRPDPEFAPPGRDLTTSTVDAAPMTRFEIYQKKRVAFRVLAGAFHMHTARRSIMSSTHKVHQPALRVVAGTEYAAAVEPRAAGHLTITERRGAGD
jgi:hypothetical protein